MSDVQVHTAPIPQAAETSGLRMVATMGGIGLLTGLLIVATFQLSKPFIDANKAAALEVAVFNVVPGAERKVAFVIDDGQLRPAEAGDAGLPHIYACYGEGALKGIAVEASGQGFQEQIRLLYGYVPANEIIVGINVLESKETPGLGDKIETDPVFLTNFEALDVALNEAKDGAQNPIVLVKKGEKTEPYQIDAITGATISSRAIATILRESIDAVAPVIQRNLEALKRGGHE